MKFLFVCPLESRVFESADFRIIENRGVITDQAGRKVLDAKVVLQDPCPFCGCRHVYRAADLPCPFDGAA